MFTKSWNRTTKITPLLSIFTNFDHITLKLFYVHWFYQILDCLLKPIHTLYDSVPSLHWNNGLQEGSPETDNRNTIPITAINLLLDRYSFWRINNWQLLKTLREMKKLLVTSNFFFSHNVFYSTRKLYPHLPIFLTSYLYLLLNWKSPYCISERG